MVGLRSVENMRVSKEVLDKIKAEEQKHPHREFGGFLIVKPNGYVKDIIFDMSNQSAGSVNLGTKEILNLSPKQRKMVKGWFHKHPIIGLSWTDRNAISKLTKLWGTCYTMVLQSNGKLLLLKTLKAKEFGNKPINISYNYNYGDFPIVEWTDIKLSWPNFKFWKKSSPTPEKPATTSNKSNSTTPSKKPTSFKKPNHPKKDAVSETRKDLIQLKPIDKELIVEVFRTEIPFGIHKIETSFTNRDKKFKIWDQSSKTMSNPFTFEMLLKENRIPFPDQLMTHDDIINRLFRNRLTILQYTTFNDTYGTEIYESDRVSFSTSFPLQKTGIVEFRNGAWKISVNENNNTNWFDIYKEVRNLKFISNIETEVKQHGRISEPIRNNQY